MQRLTAGRYGAVIRALEGIRNRQALTVMLGGFLLVAIVAGLGSGLGAWAASPSLAVGLNLLALILAASVVNAAGLALMDAARGENERGFIQLLSGGAGCLVRFLAIIALNLFGVVLFSFLHIPKPEAQATKDHPGGRSTGELLKTPVIAVSIIVAMVSYALMNLVMTSTPLAVVGCGFEPATANNIVSARLSVRFRGNCAAANDEGDNMAMLTIF